MHCSPKLVSRCIAATSALLIASGCGSFVDPLGPAVDVSLTVLTPAATSSTLYVNIGSRAVSLQVPRNAANSAVGRIRGTGYGNQPVRVTLMGSTGDTLASVSFTQKLEPGYRYGIGAIVGSRRFLGVCAGTPAVAPLRNSTSDSLFVSAAGIPFGAVC